MTPQECAEKIIHENRHCIFVHEGCHLSDKIAAQIQEAMDEATRAALKVRDNDVKTVADSVNRAVAEERERAAKIAEKWIDNEPTPPYQRGGAEIAKAIREGK